MTYYWSFMPMNIGSSYSFLGISAGCELPDVKRKLGLALLADDGLYLVLVEEVVPVMQAVTSEPCYERTGLAWVGRRRAPAWDEIVWDEQRRLRVSAATR